ncbi:MAG: DUF3455 domain-containing protein [Gemmatimonadota bacterium]
MKQTGWHRTTKALLQGAAAIVVTACAGESPLAPRAEMSSRALTSTLTAVEGTGRQVELGTCEQLRAPGGGRLAVHLYAAGVQIYHWDGARWVFDGPSAALYANAGLTGQVGTHSAGPIWVHNGGGTVRGGSPVACAVDPTAIPWLRLRATPDAVAGIFNRVTTILRVNTTGGIMPVGSGTPGEVRRVPYTAEYYFYR